MKVTERRYENTIVTHGDTESLKVESIQQQKKGRVSGYSRGLKILAWKMEDTTNTQ